ncbi:hypothetical protein SDC9_205405 [bioreactor metagenome]|uniref:Uncharacterized protein n=1 Tax=bioreactor metagenome TaxID=1076179 RepID=A0A645J297_9ZZZZ
MALGLFFLQKQAGGFHHIIGSAFAPLNHGGIFLGIYRDLAAVHNQFAVDGFHRALKLAMNRIVLNHVHHIIQIDKRVVYADNLKCLRAGNRSTENETADTAKTINTNFDSHIRYLHFFILTLFYLLFANLSISLSKN